QKQAASSPPAMAASGVSVSSAPVPLDSLPYTFTRHGVEIRVYSIELNPEGQLGVNIKLLETRGAAHEVTPSTLFQVQTSSGETLSYLQYDRGGQSRQEDSIAIQ